ncbi:hypothetical protein MMC13_003778 [Lambiella insularis]|nr:hypothetical protein [Lambiella insularis]
MAVTTHVPAWKKLGLKLKYAKDTPDPSITQSDHSEGANGGTKKRKTNMSVNELGAVATDPRQAKKAKKLKNIPGLTSSLTRSSIPQPLTTITQQRTAVPAPSHSPTKRKSVSFTPETKATDGEGAKRLYAAWLAQQGADFDPTTAPQALRHITPPQITAAPSIELSTSSAAKKLKVSKAGKPPQPKAKITATKAASDSPILPTLQYLQSYHTSRDTWKFNKSKQNQLLKHAFNVHKIPPQYDDALKAYMEGLQSSSARKRVREEAEEIIKQDEQIDREASADKDAPPSSDDDSHTPNLETEAERDARRAAKYARRASEPRNRQNYRHALQHYTHTLRGEIFAEEEREQALDPAWKARLLLRKRAELMLWSTDDDNAAGPAAAAESHGLVTRRGAEWEVRPGLVLTGAIERDERATAKRQKGDGGVVVKRKRKRKRRTGLPDDDSSSSESDLSSDSGEEHVRQKKAAERAKKLARKGARRKRNEDRQERREAKLEEREAELRKRGVREKSTSSSELSSLGKSGSDSGEAEGSGEESGSDGDSSSSGISNDSSSSEEEEVVVDDLEERLMQALLAHNNAS